MAQCHICGNTADSVSPLLSDSGTSYRTAHRVSCLGCGTYDVTMMEAAILDDRRNLTAEDRYRLSAATRNASDRGETLELTSDSTAMILEATPRPEPPEQMEIVLRYIAEHAGPDRRPVRLAPDFDYPVAYANGPKDLLFVLRGLHDKRLIREDGGLDVPHFLLTMAGYERIRELGKGPEPKEQETSPADRP